MSLRMGKDGKLLAHPNGQLVSGDAQCGCCLCCGGYSGDEQIKNDYDNGTKLLQMDSGIYVVIDESTSTLVQGPDAGNFCELKFDLDLTIHDPLGYCIQGGGGFPPTQGGDCETTGELFMICDCDICPDGIVWELRIEPCPGETCEIPSPIYLGGDCTSGYCDNPECSNCAALSTPGGDTISGAGFVVHNPDGGTICQCPGNYCDEGEEF